MGTLVETMTRHIMTFYDRCTDRFNYDVFITDNITMDDIDRKIDNFNLLDTMVEEDIKQKIDFLIDVFNAYIKLDNKIQQNNNGCVIN